MTHDNDGSSLPASPISFETAEEIYDRLRFLPGWKLDDDDDFARWERIADLLHVLQFNLFFGEAASQLKHKRGRPREWAVDQLIAALGVWYWEATGQRPPTSMNKGPFVRFVEELLVSVYPSRSESSIGDLVRNSHRRYRR